MIYNSSLWDEKDLIYPVVPNEVLERFNLKELSIFKDMGVPKWAAPNMMFYEKVLIEGGSLIFCEDRDDRKVGINLSSGKVESISDERQLFNSSFLQFMDSIYLYAEMVDLALKEDESAFVACRIPDGLIHGFLSNLEKCDLLAVSKESFGL